MVLALALATPALAQSKKKGGGGGGNKPSTDITYVLTFEGDPFGDPSVPAFWTEDPSNEIVGTMDKGSGSLSPMVRLNSYTDPDVCMAIGGPEIQPQDDCVDAPITTSWVDLLSMPQGSTVEGMRLVMQWIANGTEPLPWSAKKWDRRWALIWQDNPETRIGTLSVTRTAADTWVVVDTGAPVTLIETPNEKGPHVPWSWHSIDVPLAFTLRCAAVSASECQLPQ